MLFEITEKQILALKAVVYGCNTNRRLVGATFVSGVGSESEQTISFYDAISIADDLLEQPAVDAVPVVRCKDCKWFLPRHIKLDDGTIRSYTEEEKKLPLGVSGDVGINCGSRCLRHLNWEKNRIPVWFQENDFCSYGERRGDG